MNLGTKIALTGGVILASTFLIYTLAKDGGKKKYQIIHHANGEMVTYDTVIPMSSKFTPEEFLKKKGISSENVEIIMVPSGSDKNIDGKGKKTIVKEIEMDSDNGGEKVEINVEIDENGKKTVKKTVNGKEVKLTDAELKELESHHGDHGKVLKMEIDGKEMDGKEERVEISVEVDENGKKTITKTVNGKEINMTEQELEDMHSSEKHGEHRIEIEIDEDGGDEEKKIIQKEMHGHHGGGKHEIKWESANGEQQIMLMTSGSDETATIVLVTENYDEKSDGQSKIMVKHSKEERSMETDAPDGPFKIRYESDEKAQTDIVVTDAAGKTVFDENLGMFSGAYEKEVDLKKFGTGEFTITITSGKNKEVQKVIFD